MGVTCLTPIYILLWPQLNYLYNPNSKISNLSLDYSHLPRDKLLRTVYLYEEVWLQIVVVWGGDKPPPTQSRWPILPPSVTLHILHEGMEPRMTHRFSLHPLLQTSAILSLDEDALLTTDEVDFAFEVWRAFPERIIGYPARSHFWDDAKVSFIFVML